MGRNTAPRQRLVGSELRVVRLCSEVVRCFSPQVYSGFPPALTDAGESTALLSIRYIKRYYLLVKALPAIV